VSTHEPAGPGTLEVAGMALRHAAAAPAAAQQQSLRFDIDDRALAHEIAAALTELMAEAPDALTLFEHGQGWRIEAYYACPPEPDTLARDLEAAVGRAVALPVVVAVPDANWVAISQAALPPVRIGRFVIHGSHDRRRVVRGPNSIEIEAGEAFGTAHHATTQGCLRAIDRLAHAKPSMRRVLDLGCGSGVLAIAVARTMPRADILASDIDQRSVEVAAENASLNRAASRIRTVRAMGLAHRDLRRGGFDLILANILAGPLLKLAGPLSKAAARKGTIVLSGLLTSQAPQVIATYRSAGFVLLDHWRSYGWSTLVLERRALSARASLSSGDAGA